MSDIRVTLPAGYLARNVVLKVARLRLRRLWTIQASAFNGGAVVPGVIINGKPSPSFPTHAAAESYLAELSPPPYIWATPRERSQGPLLHSLAGASGWRGQHAEQGAF